MSEKKTENRDLENPETKRKMPLWRRFLRIALRAFIIIFLLLFLLVLFIRSPWGQDIIVGKLTKYVTDKTHTEVSVGKLFITFSGKIDLQKLYLEDQKGDTLLYSKELKAAIPLWPIIKGEPISINRVTWDGLKANVYRKDTLNGFNYQFLIDAFATDETVDTTESESPKINLGSIDFSNFDLHYQDEVSGMDARLDLGTFHFVGKNFDLDKMNFGVKSIALENSSIQYTQTKALPSNSNNEETATETSGDLPFLSVDKLSLKQVNLEYISQPDSLEATVNLDDFLLKVPKVDLNNQVVDVEKISLSNSLFEVNYHSDNQNNNINKVEIKEKQENSFEWPDWEINIKDLALENNHLNFQNEAAPKVAKGFDPDHIDLTGFNFKMKAINLSKNEALKAKLEELSFNESSGIGLKKLAFDLNLDANNLDLTNFNLAALNSSLTANVKTQYQSIDQLINQPEKSLVTLNLPAFSIDLKDLFQFSPELKSNEYLNTLSQRKIEGQLQANGNLDELKLSKLIAKWGPHTRLNLNGQFLNITDPDKLRIASNSFDVRTIDKDLTAFVSEEDLGISVPENIHLTGQIQGLINDIKAKVLLQIPEGEVQLDGAFKNNNQYVFSADLDVRDLALGKILENPDIGIVDFNIKTHGQGKSLNDLNAELSSKFSKLEYNGYDFSALDLQGEIDKGKGNVDLSYRDYNLDLDVNSKIDIDSVLQKVNLAVKLNGADLYSLGLTDKKLKAKLYIDSDIQFKDQNIDSDTHLSEGTVVYDKKSYHLGDVNLKALLHKDSTAVDINSDFLNGKLRSNANLDSISLAMKKQMKRYFYDSIPTDSTHKPVQLKLKMDFVPNDLITEVFVPSIKEMDTLKMKVNFKESEKLFQVDVDLPYINYADKIIEDLQLDIDATEDSGHFKFGFDHIDAGAFAVNPTYFDGDLKNGKLTVDFNSVDNSGETYYSSQTIISGKKNVLKIHLSPDKLMLKGEDWNIPETNKIEIDKKEITATDFVLTRGNQEIKIANDLIHINKNNIGIGFKNYSLSNFLAMFNPDELIAEGQMQGKIVAVNPMGKMGLLANFSIENLEALQTPLGDLTLKGISKEENHYRFKMDLKGEDVDLETKGNYVATEEDSQFKLDLNLNKFGLKTIDQLSGDNIEEGSGYLSGKVSLHKAQDEFKYEGFFKFNEASFRIAQLNTKFYLADEKFGLNNKGIGFNNFTIKDEQGNALKLDGKILTQNILDPEFDLKVDAKDFQPINSSEKDNEDYYGTINLDLDGTVTGKMSFPKVDLDIGINKNTDFTYVLSESQSAIEKQDGIVEFVNKDNPDDIMTRQSDSLNKVKFKGIQLHSRIKIDKDAKFGVIVDPRAGDNLEISGEGDLDFRIDRNGKMNLTGRYVINDGFYKMNLYHLVKRQFDFKEGSVISWNGDPMDADLDVTALYKMKTSASGLMASQTAGASQEEQNKYRQVLPFVVGLNIKGTIDQPDLSFGLDMPEDAKGAIGGSVYERINQLNDEDQGELNKQVFSLLVLNRFYPEAGSDGSEGGVANLARDNLNQALSDQLNTFSDKLMGDTGVQLNFGLDSYTDYQGKSAEERTDLNVTAQKKLFNDRLVVKAGTDINVQGETRPGEESPLVGNVSIEYLLTKDGRWRIQGFRKTEYENVIDGQVFVNGIGLVFQRQFNHFRELYKSFFSHTEEEKKAKKKKNKDNK